MNLELEKLQVQFATHVDEHEIEIEGLLTSTTNPYEGENHDPLLSFVSPRSDWQRKHMPDSALVSQQSDATLASSVGPPPPARSSSNSAGSERSATTTTAANVAVKPRSQSSHSFVVKQNSLPVTQSLIGRLTDRSHKNQSRYMT